MTVRAPRTARSNAKQAPRWRDLGSANDPGFHNREVVQGRRWISVIGIDQYRSGWRRLDNAVNDARGVLEMFGRLGFQPAADPLLDQAANRDALRHLVTDQLMALDEDDSLIVFFAGHGHTATTAYSTRGYLIPVDADSRDGNRHTWIRLDHWLGELAESSARHILVILDSCHSGIALSSDIHARGSDPTGDRTHIPVGMRCSRRVISSAHDNESAQDGGGPVRGHSLFTGCLINAIQGGLARQIRQPFATVDELYVHLHRQVLSESNQQQTPRAGKLEFDDGGEFSVPLAMRTRRRPDPKPPVIHPEAPAQRPPQDVRAEPRLASPTAIDVSTSADILTPTTAAGTTAQTGTPPQKAADVPAEHRPRRDRTESWVLDPEFVTGLDRHAAERARGYQVLSLIGGDALATQTAWATWAARRGYLTLLTEGAEPAATIADLLAQTPWLRCLPEARKRLAAAAGIEVEAVDAALDSRSPSERRRWIDNVAALDRHALVSGWLLAALREARARVPDLVAAPAHGAELLGIACDLAAPTAVLLHHPAPTETWLAQAIETAAALTPHLGQHSVAVAAPDTLITSVLRSARDSRALTMGRQGRITLARPAQREPGRGRSRTICVLHAALASDRRTRGHFELDAQIALEGGLAVDVDLLAPRARIAVEIDGWHHFRDAAGYRRDRDQDLRLQCAGYFVMRFLTEDVDERIASTLDQIALALAGRRSSRALP